MLKHFFYRQALNKKHPVYQALWAETIDFEEVLISPVMLQDHMPDKILDALNKVCDHMRTHRFDTSYVYSIEDDMD